MIGASPRCCVLLAMDTLAGRDCLNISGATVDVEISLTNDSLFRIGAISLLFRMPQTYPNDDRMKLKRAAGMCPIRPSFHPDIPLSVQLANLITEPRAASRARSDTPADRFRQLPPRTLVQFP